MHLRDIPRRCNFTMPKRKPCYGGVAILVLPALQLYHAKEETLHVGTQFYRIVLVATLPCQRGNVNIAIALTCLRIRCNFTMPKRKRTRVFLSLCAHSELQLYHAKEETCHILIEPACVSHVATLPCQRGNDTLSARTIRAKSKLQLYHAKEETLLLI